MDMAGRPHAPGEFDCRMAGTAAEIGHHVAGADGGRRVEGLSRRGPSQRSSSSGSMLSQCSMNRAFDMAALRAKDVD
jgi:hypothetical protein